MLVALVLAASFPEGISWLRREQTCVELEVRSFSQRRTFRLGEVTFVESHGDGMWRVPVLNRTEPPLELRVDCETRPPDLSQVFASREDCEAKGAPVVLEDCDAALRDTKAEADALTLASHQDKVTTMGALSKAKRVWSMVNDACAAFEVKRQGDQVRLINEAYELSLQFEPLNRVARVFIERSGLGIHGSSGGELWPLMLGKDVVRLGDRWLWLKPGCAELRLHGGGE